MYTLINSIQYVHVNSILIPYTTTQVMSYALFVWISPNNKTQYECKHDSVDSLISVTSGRSLP